MILELRDLVKDYPGHRAVDGVTLSIERGAFFSLLGPSGCGKTTTLRLVAGFERPTSGDVLLDGIRVNDRKPYERNVSTVFQNYALFPHLTVGQNVGFGLSERKNRKRKTEDRKARVIAALELVQLAGKSDRKPAELSGGERQRAALARSLVLEPDVLLLDEPLAALDPKLRKQMRAELKELQRRVFITFLFVTHDQEEALSMSDRIALMNRGRIDQIGTPEDIYLHPATPFAAGFLGAVNWIDGIGVRPEATRISRSCPEGDVRLRAAKVVRSVFLGNCVHVHAQLATGEPAVAEIGRGRETFSEGDPVHLYWSSADEMRFDK